MSKRPGPPIFATIAAENYKPQFCTLLASLRKHAPDAELRVLMIDGKKPTLPPELTGVRLDEPAGLPLPGYQRLAVRFTVTELATALKPIYLRQLIEERQPEWICYVDPDLMFLTPPDLIRHRLRDHDILLTPHFSDPAEAGRVEHEILYMRSGAYNLGFLGLRPSENVLAFLQWWHDRVMEHCSEDAIHGVFTDQRWLDLAPGMFPGVCVERHPGLNVAAWNLMGRPLERTEDGYRVRGEPLIFFHFSKVRLGADPMRFLEGRPYTPATEELVRHYLRELQRFGATAERAWEPPAHDRLPNGERVPRLLRQVLREMDGNTPPAVNGAAELPHTEVLRRLVVDEGARQRLRATAWWDAARQEAGTVEACQRRYQQSRLFRWYVNWWFYWFGPRHLKIPIDWVEPRPWRRRVRGALGATARQVKGWLRGAANGTRR